MAPPLKQSSLTSLWCGGRAYTRVSLWDIDPPTDLYTSLRNVPFLWLDSERCRLRPALHTRPVFHQRYNKCRWSHEQGQARACVSGAISWLRAFVSGAISWLRAFVSGAISWLRTFVSGAISWLLAFVSGAISWLLAFVSGAISWLRAAHKSSCEIEGRSGRGMGVWTTRNDGRLMPRRKFHKDGGDNEWLMTQWPPSNSQAPRCPCPTSRSTALAARSPSSCLNTEEAMSIMRSLTRFAYYGACVSAWNASCVLCPADPSNPWSSRSCALFSVLVTRRGMEC